MRTLSGSGFPGDMRGGLAQSPCSTKSQALHGYGNYGNYGWNGELSLCIGVGGYLVHLHPRIPAVETQGGPGVHAAADRGAHALDTFQEAHACGDNAVVTVRFSARGILHQSDPTRQSAWIGLVYSKDPVH